MYNKTDEEEEGKEEVHCTEPNFTLKKSKQKFISLELMMECLNCQYQGPPKKLYYTMDKPLTSFNKPGGGGNNRGSKASTLNASLAAALMNSMIGPTQIRRLFLEIGVDVGPASTLQNLCNQITHLTKQLANDSMDRGIEEIIEQKERGNATHISQDGCYNNRKRPGPCQPGTQTIFTSVGSNGKILAFQTLNKLCPKGKRLEAKNLGSCEEGHPGCLQTLEDVAPISQEGRMALDALFSLREKGYIPDYLSVDGDTQIRNKIEAFSAECEKNIIVQYDPNHWVKNLEKHLNKTKPFVDDGTFDGECRDNQKIRQGSIKKFCQDISNRCRGEIKVCSELTEHLTEAEARQTEMQRMFSSDLKEAILNCLQGKCGTLCENHSLVCKGEGQKMSRKAMLGDHVRLKGLNLSVAKDRINEYFEKDRISEVYMQIDTNMNEALHRGYQRTNPKLTSYARNYEGRISREVIHFNEGIAASVEMVNEAIGHKTCASVKEKLKKEQKFQEYQTKYSKKETTSLRKFQRLSNLHQKHTRFHRSKKQTKTPYKKGIDLI